MARKEKRKYKKAMTTNCRNTRITFRKKTEERRTKTSDKVEQYVIKLPTITNLLPITSKQMDRNTKSLTNVYPLLVTPHRKCLNHSLHGLEGRR